MISPRHIILSLAASTAVAATCMDNALALPSQLYVLSGTPAHFYTQSYLKRWSPYDFHVQVKGDCAFSRRIPQVTTVSAANDGDRVWFDLIDGNDFELVATDTLTLRVAADGHHGRVTAQIIGDSFVQGAFYRTALVDSAMVPGLELVGLRRLEGSQVHCDEGRGGWTLADYFTVPKGDFTPYAGFMQPTDDRRYLGATAFWVNCHKVNCGQITDFESRYQCGRYAGCACRFDAATGLPVAPRRHDMMWDSAKGSYICYDGKKWKSVAAGDEPAWTFNYSKYLEIWDLEAPEFLFETLGLNDFRDMMDADYGQWDERLELMKESYLKARPDGHFAIVIPCSSCGSMNNRRGDFTARQNACMWNFRRHLIDTFDHREAEGYHIVDMGITIDNDGGYRTDAEGLQTGNPHPYPNYPAMGEPLAAFIQYHRR